MKRNDDERRGDMMNEEDNTERKGEVMIVNAAAGSSGRALVNEKCVFWKNKIGGRK